MEKPVLPVGEVKISCTCNDTTEKEKLCLQLIVIKINFMHNQGISSNKKLTESKINRNL